MICPQCGYELGNNNKCMRCGYEVKTLVPVDEKSESDGENAEEREAKVIDPESTYLTDEYGNSVDDDDDGYYDPFDMLFGNLFDPIGDLLGGLFGFDVQPSRTQRSAHTRISEKQKQDDNVVEVKKVEIYDENGNQVKQDGVIKKTVNKVKSKIKNMTGGKNGKTGSK